MREADLIAARPLSELPVTLCLLCSECRVSSCFNPRLPLSLAGECSVAGLTMTPGNPRIIYLWILPVPRRDQPRFFISLKSRILNSQDYSTCSEAKTGPVFNTFRQRPTRVFVTLKSRTAKILQHCLKQRTAQSSTPLGSGHQDSLTLWSSKQPRFFNILKSRKANILQHSQVKNSQYYSTILNQQQRAFWSP
jgi:hypothetical protein